MATTRAPRACLNCRTLKVRCTGESQCQRCVSIEQPCVYAQGRQDRLKTITEQNMHMITLMKRLQERVEGEDKQQISDLLESFDNFAPRNASTSKCKKTGIETPDSSDAETNNATGISTKGYITRHKHADDTGSAGRNSNNQSLQDLPCDRSQIQTNKSASSIPTTLLSVGGFPPGITHLQSNQSVSSFATTLPSVSRYSPESTSLQTNATSAKRSSDHFHIDSALLEIYWYLQTKSEGEAQEFLKYIRSNGPLSLMSTHKWLQDRQTSIAHPQSTSLTVLHEPLVGKKVKLGDESPRKQWKTIVGINDQPIYESSEAERCSPLVTVATVRSAVDMFFKATGLLFYVFPKEQADSIQHDLLNEAEYPGDTPFTAILRKSNSAHKRAQLAEICGVAGVGLLYLRLLDKQQPPPLGLSDYFYSTTKQMLDSTIETNPLRAMKVCALLAMYNIVVKGSVALAYVELGLGLAETHGIDKPSRLGMGTEVFLDHRRTWRTLLTFAGWLGASLGHVSKRSCPSLLLLEEIEDAEDEDIVQRELVKVTIIKSRIIRAIPKDGAMSDFVIDSFRQELNAITKGLVDWMTLGALLNSKKPTPLRRIIMYFHMFFLSAMMLLHRRALADLTSLPAVRTANKKIAVREGLMAAKLAARILALMRQEDCIVQLCWLCIYSSYTSGIIILQAAVQKILNGHPDSTWIADLTLVNVSVDVLNYCAETDPVASKLSTTLSTYMDALQRIKSFQLNTNLGENMDEGGDIDYLLTITEGNSTLELAARDLQRLIQYPFGTFLELIPEGGPKAPDLQKTLVSWMEAAVGAPQEWTWELQNCAMQPNSQKIGETGLACQMGDVIANINPGHFVPMGEASPWSTWTTPNFM